MNASFLPAFGMTLLAGLSTGIGSLIALLTRHTNRKFLSVALGFSAGVMIYVSLVEILAQAQTTLPAAREYGENHLALYGLIGGMAVMAVSLLLFL